MSYPSTVDTGQIPPWIVENEPIAVLGTNGTLTANWVYLEARETQVQLLITGMKCTLGSTATGTTDMGIYDSSGNLLVHTGAVTNTASAVNSNAFSSPYTLPPGRYYLALCPSNATDTYTRVGGIGNQLPLTRNRLATNAGTSGVLPSTTGGTSTTGTGPSFAALISGGLS